MYVKIYNPLIVEENSYHRLPQYISKSDKNYHIIIRAYLFWFWASSLIFSIKVFDINIFLRGNMSIAYYSTSAIYWIIELCMTSKLPSINILNQMWTQVLQLLFFLEDCRVFVILNFLEYFYSFSLREIHVASISEFILKIILSFPLNCPFLNK